MSADDLDNLLDDIDKEAGARSSDAQVWPTTSYRGASPPWPLFVHALLPLSRFLLDLLLPGEVASA